MPCTPAARGATLSFCLKVPKCSKRKKSETAPMWTTTFPGSFNIQAMDTMEKLEEYLDALEEYVFTSIAAASPPGLRESINSLWADIARYGPAIPTSIQSRIPGLGDFEIPPPPPPPPPMRWSDKGAEWAGNHPWLTSGGLVVGVGTALLVGYQYHYRRIYLRAKGIRNSKADRRQVVVVLGGDTPFGLPLILSLEEKGYIVLASVSTPESGEALERQCHGFVRSLVLDPSQPDSSVPTFLRSLASTLSRRFPITSSGDPYASPASHPYIQSIISLLALPHPSSESLAPLEQISLSSTYLSYLTQTQITPLQIIQSLLPLLRNPHVPNHGKKTIVACLPATETRVGLPFEGVQSMTAASTLRAMEVLRREIEVSAMTGKSETMKNISVVMVDTGSFEFNSAAATSASLTESTPQTVYKSMEKWSASEKITYGPAFASRSQAQLSMAARKPSDVDLFVSTVIGVVSNGRYGYGPVSSSSFARRLRLGKFLCWLRGNRISVGAGAKTYYIASLLPSTILNTLLNIPSILISIRNSLLTTQPFVTPPGTVGAAPPAQPLAPNYPSSAAAPASNSDTNTELLSSSEGGSEAEADVESNAEDMRSALVDGSWISLPEGEEVASGVV